ncbi:MAG: glycoside hydrolase family 3 C-terminal domain-containing protein [Victivallales bacterium]|nr:glycoside hydrolase family 3 C-terminal domain-containing protein [Victivallales bacterium]
MKQKPVFPWFDAKRPFEERVELLLKSLTIKEKLSLLRYDAPAIPRVGIPAFNWWNEALHGVARAGIATVFPQAIGLAATFDPACVKAVACAIAMEGRAKNAASRKLQNTDLKYHNLTYWSPNINIFRDPRWGRGQETYGEDPFLTGEIGKAFVQGLQGDHPKYLLSAACAKHFWGHSGPEELRHGFDAKISPYDAAATYLPAFEKLVCEAHVAGVMGAYNRTNGQACCGSKDYLRDLLRKKWGFDGYTVSDCGAISDIFQHHALVDSMTDAAAMALNNGCNINCGKAFLSLFDAYREGKISSQEIDEALRHALLIQMRLGLFDPDEQVPGAQTPQSVVCCAAHRRLARKAAAESMVLLKNDGTLPLSRDLRAVALAGPNVEAFNGLWGNYNGIGKQMVTPLEGILARLNVGTGVVYVNPNATSRPSITDENPDVVIYVGGFNESLEGEQCRGNLGGDRENLDLPPEQRAELNEIYLKGVKVILVVIGGSPVDLSQDLGRASAILFVPYPGEQGGEALAEILFGKISPSGRLPVTFPYSLKDVPPFEDYCMRGRTYRYATAKPQFPFGFGLSYTKFAYSDLQCTSTGKSIRLAFTLKNTGTFVGDEVVQVYWRQGRGGYPVPNCELVAFRRVSLKPGTSKHVSLTIPKERFVAYGKNGAKKSLAGRSIELFLGGDSSLNAPLTTTIQLYTIGFFHKTHKNIGNTCLF